MILAIDIGNTHTVVGGFSGGTLSFVARLSTNPTATADELAANLKSVLSLRNIPESGIDGIAVSSVVPPLNGAVRRALVFLFAVEPLFVGPGVRTGLNIHCDVPSTVGADLIAASVAAGRLYGTPALVIDMGTATKMIAIDASGAFVGVSIIPGIHVALTALSEKAAQLPMISLEAPRSVIGKNTVDSMRSGAVFGNASMIDGMIERFAEALGQTPHIVATGGLAPVIVPHCKHKIPIDEHLLLTGLYMIYERNVK